MNRGYGRHNYRTPRSVALPPAGFAVLPAAGTPTYTVTTTVLSSTDTSYVVSTTVKDSAGNSYTPI